MRYMFLIYTLEANKQQMSPQEMAEVMNGHQAVIQETTRLGILHGVSPLHSTSTATTVRHQNGKPLIIDGPFAETKEQLGGYYIIDCKDLDEAISWAKRIPTACGGGNGCIEIRALQDMTEVRKKLEGLLATQNA
jgi:hypothetical protein